MISANQGLNTDHSYEDSLEANTIMLVVEHWSNTGILQCLYSLTLTNRTVQKRLHKPVALSIS